LGGDLVIIFCPCEAQALHKLSGKLQKKQKTNQTKKKAPKKPRKRKAY
jgi:hypothetical protein